MDRSSKLKLYSTGIVTQAKQADSDYIRVWPSEVMPMVSGNIDTQNYDYNVNLPDAKGNKQVNKAKGEAVIVAKWMSSGNSNRITPPDVQANETVNIYRYADTDEYYWDTTFREPSLRRQETVCHAYSNIKSGMKPFDKTTSYWNEWDTVGKSVTLMHTNKNDGESFSYIINTDTAKGVVTITDNVGNSFVLDSSTGYITTTGLKRVILQDLSGDSCVLDADANSYTVTTGKTITLHSGSTSVTVDGSGGNIVASAPNSIQLNAPSVTVNGKQVKTV